MNGLTPRQFECLAFLKSYISQHGYSPSFAEIGEGLGLASKSNVHRLVHGLIDRGAVRLLTNASRSLGLTDEGWALASRKEAA